MDIVGLNHMNTVNAICLDEYSLEKRLYNTGMMTDKIT